MTRLPAPGELVARRLIGSDRDSIITADKAVLPMWLLHLSVCLNF